MANPSLDVAMSQNLLGTRQNESLSEGFFKLHRGLERF